MQTTRWTFVGFELDLKAGTLHKNGAPVRIGQQAFRALALLVARGGELVTREELQKEIWGERVVEFEHGLNECIRQVRAALGDHSTIIVTCPREGYRLGVQLKPVANARWPPVQRWRAAVAGVALLAAGYLSVASVVNDHAARWSESGPDAVSAAEPNRDLLSATSSRLPGAFSRPWPTRSVEAYEWFSRGLWYHDRSSGVRPFGVLSYFARATALDPRFALAHAGIAVAYLDRAESGVAAADSIVRARQAAHRALALDAQSPEARVAFAELSYRLDDDVLTAHREFARAVELDARNAYVRQRYAAFLQDQREFDAALEQLRAAQELDALSVRSIWLMAETLLAARRYEESLAQARRALEIEPNHLWSLRTVGRSLEAMGRYEEAIEAYMRAGPDAVGQLGRVYALLGRRAEALELLKGLSRRPVDDRGHNGVVIALIYAGLNEPAKATEWLEKAHLEGVRLLPLQVSPEWQPFRASPAFKEFVTEHRHVDVGFVRRRR